jgi:hypothetical protein
MIAPIGRGGKPLGIGLEWISTAAGRGRGKVKRCTAALGPLHPEPMCTDAAVHTDGTANAPAGVRILGIQ